MRRNERLQHRFRASHVLQLQDAQRDLQEPRTASARGSAPRTRRRGARGGVSA
jgi:hypothetical protein